MKQKIIIFIIGLLTGAVISTGAIFIYTLADKDSQTSTIQTSGGQIDPNNQGGQGGQMNNGGTPPEMPTNDQNSSQGQTN